VKAAKLCSSSLEGYMPTVEHAKKQQDDYEFLVCCNLELLVAAWNAYDGEASPVVNGREVDERSLVYAMQELGHYVVI
jgi:hypothetical protein